MVDSALIVVHKVCLHQIYLQLVQRQGSPTRAAVKGSPVREQKERGEGTRLCEKHTAKALLKLIHHRIRHSFDPTVKFGLDRAHKAQIASCFR